ncbi:hypothetical protein GN958_ATG13008 [Phytophthora infestans]|uniref:Uncharacterized protein n=1 Tax=Phytophthora infestans TaxID=4787 RepID=A0A8S9UAC0_PHYIN|nr:hypothetical protein GN958_ATG13008 [Phytophthora infestans]
MFRAERIGRSSEDVMPAATSACAVSWSVPTSPGTAAPWFPTTSASACSSIAGSLIIAGRIGRSSEYETASERSILSSTSGLDAESSAPTPAQTPAQSSSTTPTDAALSSSSTMFRAGRIGRSSEGVMPAATSACAVSWSVPTSPGTAAPWFPTTSASACSSIAGSLIIAGRIGRSSEYETASERSILSSTSGLDAESSAPAPAQTPAQSSSTTPTDAALSSSSTMFRAGRIGRSSEGVMPAATSACAVSWSVPTSPGTAAPWFPTTSASACSSIAGSLIIAGRIGRSSEYETASERSILSSTSGLDAESSAPAPAQTPAQSSSTTPTDAALSSSSTMFRAGRIGRSSEGVMPAATSACAVSWSVPTSPGTAAPWFPTTSASACSSIAGSLIIAGRIGRSSEYETASERSILSSTSGLDAESSAPAPAQTPVQSFSTTPSEGVMPAATSACAVSWSVPTSPGTAAPWFPTTSASACSSIAGSLIIAGRIGRSSEYETASERSILSSTSGLDAESSAPAPQTPAQSSSITPTDAALSSSSTMFRAGRIGRSSEGVMPAATSACAVSWSVPTSPGTAAPWFPTTSASACSSIAGSLIIAGRIGRSSEYETASERSILSSTSGLDAESSAPAPAQTPAQSSSTTPSEGVMPAATSACAVSWSVPTSPGTAAPWFLTTSASACSSIAGSLIIAGRIGRSSEYETASERSILSSTSGLDAESSAPAQAQTPAQSSSTTPTDAVLSSSFTMFRAGRIGRSSEDVLLAATSARAVSWSVPTFPGTAAPWFPTTSASACSSIAGSLIIAGRIGRSSEYETASERSILSSTSGLDAESSAPAPAQRPAQSSSTTPTDAALSSSSTMFRAGRIGRSSEGVAATSACCIVVRLLAQPHHGSPPLPRRLALQSRAL